MFTFMLLLKFRGILGTEQLTSISGSSYVLTLFKEVKLQEPVIVRLSPVRNISIWSLLDPQMFIKIIFEPTTETMHINTNI